MRRTDAAAAVATAEAPATMGLWSGGTVVVVWAVLGAMVRTDTAGLGAAASDPQLAALLAGATGIGGAALGMGLAALLWGQRRPRR